MKGRDRISPLLDILSKFCSLSINVAHCEVCRIISLDLQEKAQMQNCSYEEQIKASTFFHLRICHHLLHYYFPGLQSHHRCVTTLAIIRRTYKLNLR